MSFTVRLRPSTSTTARANPSTSPGGSSPRALLVVRERDGKILQCSTNVHELLEQESADVLRSSLPDVLGPVDGARLLDHVARHVDLARTTPWRSASAALATSRRPTRSCTAPAAGGCRARRRDRARARGRAAPDLPHHLPGCADGARGPRPGLDAGGSLRDRRRACPSAHGFRPGDGLPLRRRPQREVVAEAKREDLNSFFGLHYPRPTSRVRPGRCTRRTGSA
ncbi:hypothetical protein NKG05_12220 [Oerskovia sp. M15]